MGRVPGLYTIRSLKGERVKSFEECEIANFLYLNGVSYEYENSYEHDTATPEKRQYQPDFYLPDARIYIEHFALSASGDTPTFIDRKEYLRSIEWKRKLHAEHGTILIETFSHEHTDGKLIDNLSTKLLSHGVTLSPISPDKIFSVLERQQQADPFIYLVTTFLRHYKEAQLTFSEVAQRAAKISEHTRAEAFLDVFKPIFERYQETLVSRGEIDFHDMISKATKHVKEGNWPVSFGYILVDEFQDISAGRAKLLKALLDKSAGSQLFAVGDDWQSIYRFTGSDISIMRKFENHFGFSERIDLETTFRCSDHIAAVATGFILRNPLQIPKKVRSIHRSDEPEVYIYLSGNGLSQLNQALDTIANHAATYDGTSTVLLLSRYRHLQPQNLSGMARQYPGLNLTWMTVHGSKGLEADYVVVLGLRAGKYGFPSEIVDEPLLNLVLAEPDAYPNAEERRLFYVAMTRARRQVFLLAEENNASSFILELINGRYDVKVFGHPSESGVLCPKCIEGNLVLRENSSSESNFYGCSNYPYCTHIQRPCPKCRQGLPVKENGKHRCLNCNQEVRSCPDCNGWLETKMGRYGRFLGCSSWPYCDYTESLSFK